MADKAGRLYWYRHQPADYLALTMGWPPIARLAYLELRGMQWLRGELPADPDELARLVPGITADDWAVAWPCIEPHFPPAENGSRADPTLEEERAHASGVVEERRQAGRKGAQARWQKP